VPAGGPAAGSRWSTAVAALRNIQKNPENGETSMTFCTGVLKSIMVDLARSNYLAVGRNSESWPSC
jgi:hypothetical protein